LYKYNFWYNHSVIVAVRYAGQDGIPFHLDLHTGRTFLVAGHCDGSVVAAAGQPKSYVKPEAEITVFELLMMGGVSSETC
jgi:hypothetical protein